MLPTFEQLCDTTATGLAFPLSMWNLDFASALPCRCVDAAEIAEWTDGDEAFIRDKVGIESRRFLLPDESPLDLAERAVEAALSEASLSAGELGWLIFVTQNPDYRLPQSSALLCDRIGAPCSIAAFDLSLGCSGWVYALTLANAFVTQADLGSGLIVTCDPYSRAMARDDKSTTTVFGDAAAVTVMRPGGPVSIGKAVYGTDGAGGMGLAAVAGGARHPLISIDSETGGDGQISRDCAIRMDGRAILDFMQTRIPKCVEDCLRANELDREEVDLFVFHQASRYMLALLTRRMRLDPEKVPIEMAQTGNTVSSTIPIALERLRQRGELGGNVVVCGFGVGLSWAATVIKFG